MECVASCAHGSKCSGAAVQQTAWVQRDDNSAACWGLLSAVKAICNAAVELGRSRMEEVLTEFSNCIDIVQKGGRKRVSLCNCHLSGCCYDIVNDLFFPLSVCMYTHLQSTHDVDGKVTYCFRLAINFPICPSQL